MNISGISANDPIFGADGSAPSALDRDAFMELLVAQLQNQDPLEPTANGEMIAQLAQFSSLEEMQQLNDNIVGLAVLQQSNALLSQMTSASSLIGQGVRYVDPISGDELRGRVSSVKIEDGLAILNIDGKDVPLASVVEVGVTLASDQDA